MTSYPSLFFSHTLKLYIKSNQALPIRKIRSAAARASGLAVDLRDGNDRPFASNAALFAALDASHSSHDRRMIREALSDIFHLQHD